MTEGEPCLFVKNADLYPVYVDKNNWLLQVCFWISVSV